MTNQIEYNVWNKWDPLEVAMVGSCENENFFANVKNIEIREKLTQLLIETKEDLDHFASVLEQHDVTVHRPQIDPTRRMFPNIKLSPCVTHQPRDYCMTLGNNLLVKDSDAARRYRLLFPHMDIAGQQQEAWKDLLKTTRIIIDPPSWTLVGSDLYVDIAKTPHSMKKQRKKIQEWADQHLPNTRVHALKVGGHTDGCFHTCKPGVIISLIDIQTYSETFPNWDVLYLPDQSWDAMHPFVKAKKHTQGKYWIPGEENNQPLLNFINLWLDEWVGFAEESVFDINMFMINDHTACVNNYNKPVFDYFKRHKIDPIIVPMRHRWFWDGGLHCCSLDLVRKGQQDTYV